MGKTGLSGTPSHITVNGTLVNIPNTGGQSLVILNGTVLHVRLHEPFRDSQLNELLYVIIVIVFYATALMTLIITQIKRQRREGTEVDYYDEYLQRNSEVKQTCQTANIVMRGSNPPPALATAAFAAAAAGTLLGRSPLSMDDAATTLLSDSADSNTSPTVDTQAASSSGGRGKVSVSNMSLGAPGSLGPGRMLYPRDKSPVLESIPDEEV